MSRELEIIGLGAAVGEATGPRAERPGDGPKHAVAHTECLNCGALLHGRFCAVCGQTADDHHRSIFHLMWEAVEGLTHLDGRLAKTLPPLFFRPGSLARDHFEGRRQRHVPPFRLFLVALLLFMLALELVVHGAGHHAAGAGTEHAATGGGRHITVAPLMPEQAKRVGVHLDADPAKPALRADGKPVTPEPAPAADGSIEGVAGPKAPAIPELGALPNVAPPLDPLATYEAGRKVGALVRGNVTDVQSIDENALGDDGLARWFVKKAKAAGVSPAYFTSTMFGWAHRMAVVLLPVFALLLVSCYFYRRKFYVYDHLVVSMQFLSFVFLISAVAWILPEPARGIAIAVAIVWTPVNLFMILRGAYGSSIIGALIKTLFLWISALVVFMLLMLGIVALALGQM